MTNKCCVCVCLSVRHASECAHISRKISLTSIAFLLIFLCYLGCFKESYCHVVVVVALFFFFFLFPILNFIEL